MPTDKPIKILFVFAWLVVGGEETELRLLARCLDRRRYTLEALSTYRRPNMPDQTHRQLRELGVAVDTRCYDLPPEEHAPHIARRIANDGFDLVVACQGVRPVYPAYDLLTQRPPLIEHGGLVSEAFHNPKHHTSAYVGVCRDIRDAAASVMNDPANALEIPSMVDLSEFGLTNQAEAQEKEAQIEDPKKAPKEAPKEAQTDRDAVRAAWNIRPGELVIGWAGRLDPKKRVQDFIEACGYVARERANARFVVIGGPDAFHPEYAEGLKQQAAELGLNAKMLFLGDCPDVPRLLAGVDIFVWLSRGEGMPHVIAEAGAARLPVIATRDGGTPQQIVDGVSGLFVEHENPRQVAQSIVHLMDAPDLRARLGSALHDHVVHTYSAEAVIPQWERLVAKLLFARLRNP